MLGNLRNFNNSNSNNEAQLFVPRDGYWYMQKRILGRGKKASQGDNFFVAENPPFGVEFTYYLNQKYLSKEDKRLKNERKAEKENRIISVPKWENLEEEKKELKPTLWMFIYSNKNSYCVIPHVFGHVGGYSDISNKDRGVFKCF